MVESVDGRAVRKCVAHSNGRIDSDCYLSYALLASGYAARYLVFKIQIWLTTLGRLLGAAGKAANLGG